MKKVFFSFRTGKSRIHIRFWRRSNGKRNKSDQRERLCRIDVWLMTGSDVSLADLPTNSSEDPNLFSVGYPWCRASRYYARPYTARKRTGRKNWRDKRHKATPEGRGIEPNGINIRFDFCLSKQYITLLSLKPAELATNYEKGKLQKVVEVANRPRYVVHRTETESRNQFCFIGKARQKWRGWRQMFL